MSASSREPGTGPGAAHEEGIECWTWGWRANEDFFWHAGNRGGIIHNFWSIWVGHRWVSGHASRAGEQGDCSDRGGYDMMLPMTKGSE